MASEEHTLLNLWRSSTHFTCWSCYLHKVNLQWLQHKHKVHCFREVYRADTKIPELLEIIQLKDPNGAITTYKIMANITVFVGSFPGRAYKWPNGLRCKHENPLPGTFRAITSTKGDNLKSERNISLTNYLSQGERSVISYTILHWWTKNLF